MINPINIFTQNYNTNPIKAQTTLQPKFSAPLPQDTISFTGKKEDLVRTIGHVSCPCCGTKMLTFDDLKIAGNEIAKENTAKHYVNTLKPYEEYMHKTEKETFNRFETWAKDNPRKNLENFMQENRESSLKACKDKQTETFKQINKITENINSETKENILKLTTVYSKAPYATEEDMKDVRKNLLSDIETSENKINNKETYKQLMSLADNLPTSKNNSDAFIVKYASQSSGKVAARLLKLSAGTIEHIKPQAKGGRDQVENYLLECGECNHTRGEVPLNEWVTNHPEMKENTQKYIDEVIEKINGGKLPGLENYPNMIKNAIEAQSKGTLSFDTTKLKPVQGKRLNLVA